MISKTILLAHALQFTKANNILGYILWILHLESKALLRTLHVNETIKLS